VSAPLSRTSAEAPHLAMPLGGIGTGNLAICGDGSLRQWQLHNIGNHAGALPWSFFALRVSRIEPPLDTIRVLQAPVPGRTGTPLVTDDEAPGWQHELLAAHRGIDEVALQATYPFARLRYLDDELPVEVTLEAFTPLVLHDVERSSLPVAMFTFRIESRDEHYLRGTLGAALQNAVGWDGVTPIDGVHGAGYGGNVNRVSRSGGWTSLVLENPTVPTDAAAYGQLVLAADDPRGIALEQWQRPEEFFAFLASHGLADGRSRLDLDAATGDPAKSAPRTRTGPSPAGSTWNAGLGVRFDLQPGESRVVRILLAWSFPNRFVNFEQFGPPKPEWGGSRFWLGNRYASVHGDAAAVARRVETEWDELRDASLAWPSTLESSSLDGEAVEHLAAQLAVIRSPTCFQSADGRFFGFEGVLGASTTMWSGAFGGSCPLNCTHVWNYEQALAKTFPALERSMRETELDVMQAPEGFVPHRVIVPLYLRQLWDEPIGGPEEPALDGMLGTVLKTYREVRAGAGEEWLERYWPNVVRLLAHVEAKWVRDERAVLSGIQPSTHDIDLTGVNSFMGTLWLAALRAAEELALLVGDESAERYRDLFGRASRAYDEALFDGEYYVQRLEPGDSPEFQWLEGCLSDQLIGQWWAHELGLGHVLPAEHVRSALRAVVRHNLRTGFDGFEHPFRVFADGSDTGLLMCTWPRGGRPIVPTRYCDEVWTGSEYQVAANCFREGLADEGWRIVRAVWARYDGTRRNPYNEIECGDHYARALAGWSVLDALGGVRYDAPAQALEVGQPEAGASLPFVAGEAFGLVRATDDGVELSCAGGSLELASVVLGGERRDFSPTITLEPGRPLRVQRAALTVQGAHN
jgi:non-lysosomal glucosylceramidase